jgi:hypothetical protein
MTEKTLKNLLGILIISTQVLAIALTLILWVFTGFTFDEMTTTIALIIPMLGVYIPPLYKYFYDQRLSSQLSNQGDRNLSASYIFTVLLFPSFLILLLIASIMLKALNVRFSSFEEFKGMLTIIQFLFGAYAMQLITRLFDFE